MDVEYNFLFKCSSKYTQEINGLLYCIVKMIQLLPYMLTMSLFRMSVTECSVPDTKYQVDS